MITKALLVKRQGPDWVGLESDISNGRKNGLSAAAKVAGGWLESRALEWAKQRDENARVSGRGRIRLRQPDAPVDALRKFAQGGAS